jgi:hypothetical protein
MNLKRKKKLLDSQPYIEKIMDVKRYAQLYDASKITELKHEEQIELIKLSTQILYRLMDLNVGFEEIMKKIKLYK